MLDVNVIQMLDIFVGSLPAIILQRAGYLGNGGCFCGCGVTCPSFHRWRCPGDAGFACTNALRPENVPFHGEPTRTPPCLLQVLAVVNWIIAMFFHLPALCAFAAAVILHKMSMTDAADQEVKVQLANRRAGKPFYDPVLNVRIPSGVGDHMISKLKSTLPTLQSSPSSDQDARRWVWIRGPMVFVIAVLAGWTLHLPEPLMLACATFATFIAVCYRNNAACYRNDATESEVNVADETAYTAPHLQTRLLEWAATAKRNAALRRQAYESG